MLAAIPSLRAFAISLTYNVDAADDLVQEAILRAWANIDRFQPGTNLNAWLFTILRNAFYSQYRKAHREVEDPSGAYADRLVTVPEQGARCDFEDLRTALAKALGRSSGSSDPDWGGGPVVCGGGSGLWRGCGHDQEPGASGTGAVRSATCHPRCRRPWPGSDDASGPPECLLDPQHGSVWGVERVHRPGAIGRILENSHEGVGERCPTFLLPMAGRLQAPLNHFAGLFCGPDLSCIRIDYSGEV